MSDNYERTVELIIRAYPNGKVKKFKHIHYRKKGIFKSNGRLI